MPITKKYKEMIVKEFNYVVNKMDKSPSAEEKLYYFSGAYSIIHRVFNLEYDRELIFLHFVLRQTYEALFGRLQAISKGKEGLIPLEDQHFKKLSKITRELARKIKSGGDLNDTLRKFAILSYSTTGNGYYLKQKGLLKIQDL